MFLLPTVLMFMLPLILMVACIVVAIVCHIIRKHKDTPVLWVVAAVLFIVTAHYAATNVVGFISLEVSNNIFYIFALAAILAAVIFIAVRLVALWRTERKAKDQEGENLNPPDVDVIDANPGGGLNPGP